MNSATRVGRVALSDHSRLLHEEGACLPLRSRYGGCRACADACPVGVLSVEIEAVSLADGCVHCGRCAATCPTEALSLPELAPLSASVTAPQPATLRIECRRVPAGAMDANTLVVPCTGALTTGHLLARRAAGQAVRVVDRGWCPGCSAGGGEDHPARRVVEAAVMWLEAVHSGDAPVVAHEPLPAAQMRALDPDPAVEPPEPARRAFFRGLLSAEPGEKSLQPMGSHGRAGYPADRRHPSPERERQLAALQALASAGGTEVPAEFYPRAHVDSSCCDRRMCVALCPTAALTVHDESDMATLRFSADRCIGCGNCARACPEGAIQFEPCGGQPGVHDLLTLPRVHCRVCGEPFTAAPGAGDHAAGSCPTCEKSRSFIDDARRQLFGSGRTAATSEETTDETSG